MKIVIELADLALCVTLALVAIVAGYALIELIHRLWEGGKDD